MMDLSGTSATTVTFTRGNQEHTATEYTDEDVETGALKAVDATRHGFFDDWKEVGNCCFIDAVLVIYRSILMSSLSKSASGDCGQMNLSFYSSIFYFLFVKL